MGCFISHASEYWGVSANCLQKLFDSGRIIVNREVISLNVTERLKSVVQRQAK